MRDLIQQMDAILAAMKRIARLTPFFFGVAGIGIVGGGAELDFSSMIFISARGVRVHQYFTYGGAVNFAGHCAGLPVNQEGCIQAYGLGGGPSVGINFGNANQNGGVDPIEGNFQSVNAGAEAGAFNLQASPTTWIATPAFAPLFSKGIGGYGNLTTNTVRLPDTPTMMLVNSVPSIPK